MDTLRKAIFVINTLIAVCEATGNVALKMCSVMHLGLPCNYNLIDASYNVTTSKLVSGLTFMKFGLQLQYFQLHRILPKIHTHTHTCWLIYKVMPTRKHLITPLYRGLYRIHIPQHAHVHVLFRFQSLSGYTGSTSFSMSICDKLLAFISSSLQSLKIF